MGGRGEMKERADTLGSNGESVRQQLAEIEAIYRSARIGLCVVDRQLRYLRINDHMAESNGVSVEAHLGRHVRDVIPGLAQVAEQLASQVFNTGQPITDYEVAGTTPAKPGVERQWVQQWLPLKNQLGEVVGISIVSEEITERKRTEQILRGSEQRYRSLVELSPDAILVNRNNRVALVNPAAMRLFGATSPEQLMAKPPLDLFHPDYHEAIRERIGLLLKGRPAPLLEEQIVRLDGTVRDVEVTAAPYVDPDGTAIQVVLRDITDRKQMEADLARLASFPMLNTNPVAEVMPGGEISFLNPTAQALFPDLPQLRLEHPWLSGWELLSSQPGDRDVPAASREVTVGGRTYEQVLHYVRPYGCFRIYGTDVTERKRADNEREMAIEFLHLANNCTGMRELIQAAASFFQEKSNCEAVGIRLQDGYDFPYYEVRGFGQEFVEAENSLCSHDAAGKVLRDDSGCPLIECMCGNVIQGRFDPSLPFFTQAGSFWTNSTTKLLASTTESQRQARTRNRCNGDGNESVALIPLRFGDVGLGLLQINDRRPDMFSLTTITLWERLADYLAVAIAKFRSEEALRESQADMNLAQAVAHTGSWRLDVRRNQLLWSDETHRIFGIPTGTPLTYEKFLGSVHPEDRDYVASRWAAALAGEPYDVEHRIVVGETVKWVRERAKLEFDTDGTLLGGFGTAQDITDRKAAEEVLRRYELLAGNSRDIILFMGRDDGRIMEANEAATKAYGYSRQDLLMRTIHDLRAEEARELTTGQMERADSEGILFETVHRRSDGSTFPVEVSSRGATIGGERTLISVIRDITERTRSDENLRQTAEELARSNHELQEFAYIASHDLQEPLRMVSGFLGLLRERYSATLDDKAKEYVQYAVEGSIRMSQLIDDLLEYSRVGRSARQTGPTDVEKALQQAVLSCTKSIQEADAHVEHEPLPTVQGDGPQLTQLFQNLITNAVKFRREGVAPVIRVGARSEKDHWLFWVSDNGIGLEPQHAQRIFQIFQRLHTREKYPGTGIGLAICKKIVERHGGRIWVESQPGQGATFFFTISQ